MNNVKVKERWLTLQEASEITGIKIPALRQGIKRGKYSGKQQPTHSGYRWVVSFDSIGLIQKVDNERLNVNKVDKCSGATCSGEQDNKMAELLMKQQGERIGEQSKHIATLEKLLTDFQSRINILESDKLHLEYKLKLLPAPVEVVSSRMPKLEARVKELESELEGEKKRSWWKKLLGSR